MHLDQATPEELRQWENSLSEEYARIKQTGLNLNLTRGKPSSDQLSLSNTLDGILEGNYSDDAGTDLRNYGGLDGIPEAKTLFANAFGLGTNEVMIGGNSSLTLMYFSVQTALHHGLTDCGSAWANEGKNIKFLAPVPGYDRHFSVCEHLGIELIPIAMNNDGPDMDQVESLLKSDPQIKGIWCVPRFSNPTGIVYSNIVVTRMAKLATIAGPNFRLFWDNAYAVHNIEEDAPELTNIMDACKAAGTENSVLIFGSTSKITFAGAGVAFIGGSEDSLSVLKKHYSFASIGPDKINQMRHVKFLKNNAGIQQHMRNHAALLKPRFDAVISRLQKHLGDTGMARWAEPKGGYFISFDTLPGLAKEVVRLASEAGVKLTPAGATFPYGKDPEDSNIRIAPSFPSQEDIEQAMDVFVICVKLASVRQKLTS